MREPFTKSELAELETYNTDGSKDHPQATSPYLSRPVRTEREAVLERQVAELKRVLGPFDRMAGELFSRNWDNSNVVVALHASAAFPDHRNARVTAADFFEVRRVLAALSPTSNGGDTDGR